jgi:protein phosphatase 1 regulatory subunit 11
MHSGRRCLPCVRQQSSASGGYGAGAAPSSSSGSMTQTMTVDEDDSVALDTAVNTGSGRRLVLRLKVEPQQQKKASAIKWSEDTVDNEHLNRKTSKSAFLIVFLRGVHLSFLTCPTRMPGCCIYRKQKRFAESDSDESDSDTEAAAKAPPRPGQPKNYQRHHA